MTRTLWMCVGVLAAWLGVIGLLALCVRVAGTSGAWKVGLLVIATAPLLGFATRERR